MYKYLEIYKNLESKIYNGEFRYNDKLPTEKELVEMYGFSRVTVNCALTKLHAKHLITRIPGSGSYVTYINENDGNHKITVALVLPVMNHTLVSAIRDSLQKYNINLSLFISSGSPEKELQHLEKIIADQLDAIICYPVMYGQSVHFLNSLIINDFPIIFLDRYPTSITCHSVLDNGYLNMFKMTEKLIALGHKNIGYVTPLTLLSLQTLQDRHNGFLDALEKNNIENKNSCIISPEGHYYSQKDFFTSFMNLLNSKNKPTAVICATGIITQAFLEFSNTYNFKVPENISLIGYDETPDNSISTVIQDFVEIGNETAKIIIDLFYNKISNIYKIYVPGILHNGSSILNVEPTL